MQTRLQVLTEDEKAQVHERTLNILARTGVRVDSAGGREILKEAGAQVDETSHIVRFHKNQIEEALGLAPKKFTLGARRPGWDLSLNTGDCKLLMDGEGPTVLDRNTGKHRDSTFHDWLEVTRLAGTLGAEVRGLSLAEAGDADVATLEGLLAEHLVLFFPEQYPSIDEHVAFGRRFGPLAGHPNLKNPFTDHPEVFELAASGGGVADEWHTDLTFLPEPAVMSILHMVRCPPVGGDTMWTNLYRAFEELSEPLRDLCL